LSIIKCYRTLGAERGAILKLALAQAMGLVIAGVVAGLVAALSLTRAMLKLLMGVSPADPVTYAIVAALLVGVALLACYIPARRAARCRSHGSPAPRIARGRIGLGARAVRPLRELSARTASSRSSKLALTLLWPMRALRRLRLAQLRMLGPLLSANDASLLPFLVDAAKALSQRFHHVFLKADRRRHAETDSVHGDEGNEAATNLRIDPFVTSSQP